MSGASNYKRGQKADVAVTTAAPVTACYELPRNRGKGGILLYLKVSTAGSPALTVQFQPAFADPQRDNAGAALTSAQYLLPGSATAKTARLYKGAAGFAAFSTLTVADGTIYMIELDMDGLPWDAVLFTFTVATANATLTPYIIAD